MKITIIFPNIYFTKEQLDKLGKFDVKFVEGKNIDLEKIDSLFSSEEYILIVNPVYLKDGWGSFQL